MNIEANYQDNYNEILAIFPYQAAPDVRSEYGNLDKAMEKVSKVVALRRPSHWTDDCYLKLAKCQYVKKDYESAEKTLQYLLHHFEPSRKADPRRVSETRSRTAYNRERQINQQRTRRQIERERRQARRQAERDRKQAQRDRERAQRDRRRGEAPQNRIPARSQAATEGEKVESLTSDQSSQVQKQSQEEQNSTGLFGHEPAFNEAKIWMAKNYIERDAFSRASNLLHQAHQRGLSDELKALAYLTEAHLEVSRRNYERAIEPLENAVPLVRDRRQRARYSYILGQLYQREGNFRTAGIHYDNAARWTNDFELEFNANLNQALATQTTVAGSLRELERMATDRKNVDYRDRIYYTIGQLHYNEGQIEEALAALSLAAEYHSGNENQIREIHYLKAIIQLEQEDYLAAHRSFENTLRVMPESDERYSEVSRMASSLGEIAKFYDQLSTNDTLLLVASWPKEEQRKWAERQFARDRKAQEMSRPATGADGRSTASSGPAIREGVGLGRDGAAGLGPGRSAAGPGPGPRAGQLESNFFAYDDRQIRRGAREFERRFGNRQLADDWRRSNSPFYRAETDRDFAEMERVPERIVPESKIDEYLSKLPQDDPSTLRVKQNIIDALFHLGVLFREKMKNYRVSAEHLDRLTAEFPNSNKELEGLYYLYLDYRDMGMHDEKEMVKNRIINRFPNSRHARVLEDPANAAALMEEENRLPNYYRTIVEHFEKGNFEEVQKRIARSKELFGTDHHLSPKIALLNAMSLGSVLGREAYIAELQDMIAQYPNTPEETRAREIMRFLQGDSGAFDSFRGEIDVDKFVPEDDRMHYVIVVLNNADKISLNDAQISIANFNQKYYQLSGLRISNHFLNTETNTPLILIRSFNNKTQAMRYLTDANSLSEEFLPENALFEIYPITQRNYREVLRDRNTHSYRVFFDNHYKTQTNRRR